MQARTLITAAGALLALAAPAAQAMPLYPEGDGPSTSQSSRMLQAVTPDDVAGARIVASSARLAAVAAVRPDDRAGLRGAGPGLVEASATRPDDRAGVRGPDGLAVWQDGKLWGAIDATSATRNEPAVGPSAPAAAPTVLSSPGGFDWGDAGIGAGVTSGVVLLLLGGSLLAGGRRHRTALG